MYYFCWVMIALCGVSALLAIILMIVQEVRLHKYGSGGFVLPIVSFACILFAVICFRCGITNTSCAKCGWQSMVISADEHCGGCGAKLVASDVKKYCESCYETYDASCNFCTQCGKALSEE